MGSYYREDRYCNKIPVERYDCGACKHYNIDTGKCDDCGYYFEKDNHCNDAYEEAGDLGFSSVSLDEDDEDENTNQGAGCFITTAATDFNGLPDDCHQLNVLRQFRDNVLLKNEKTRGMVHQYYNNAPSVVRALNALPEKEKAEEYNTIFGKIEKIVALIEKKNYDLATRQYSEMYIDLYSRFLLNT